MRSSCCWGDWRGGWKHSAILQVLPHLCNTMQEQKERAGLLVPAKISKIDRRTCVVVFDGVSGNLSYN
jgi:hypothetical protein